MNLDYSYRSFLITSLLTGCLILFLASVNLSQKQEAKEDTYSLELAEEELLEPEEIASLTPDKTKIETNRAYNEAEKFISSLENEDYEITETTEGKLQEMNEALENSQNSNLGFSNQSDRKPQEEKKTDFSNTKGDDKNTAVVKGANRNTTISYQLVSRKDLSLPNPVYTCEGSGRVVINIEVDKLGKVLKTTYNKNASTTSNQCLIDSASEYAAQARFNTDSSKPKQLGTITFNFPGQ